MANDRPSMIKQHYDRLAAVVVLVILLGSLLYLILAGLQRRKEAADYEGNLTQSEPVKVQLTAADTSASLAVIDEMKAPAKSRQLAKVEKTAPNLFTPERRVLCVKCMLPIQLEAETCVHCKGEQPKEKKIDYSTVDTDNDGMTDVWEVQYKLNPADATDADADADNDGFTNLEEYQAKTDPADPKSHPSYDTRLSLAKIEGVKLPFRAKDKMELPSTKDEAGNTVRHFMVTFYAVAKDGTEGKTPLRVKDGDMIGQTGFKFIRYNEKSAQIQVGEFKQTRYVNVSTIDVERESDKKQLTLTFRDANNPTWPGDPLVEQKATINIDVPNVKPVVVAPGATFTVKGEKYTVKAINETKKTVTLEKNATKSLFELK